MPDTKTTNSQSLSIQTRPAKASPPSTQPNISSSKAPHCSPLPQTTGPSQKRLSTWYNATIISTSLTGRLLRRARRMYYGTFRKDYVKKSVEQNRQGQCHQCGACCELIYKCPFLGKDHTNMSYCRIYGDLRPSNCHVYPFDKIDSEIPQCGFSFPEQKA